MQFASLTNPVCVFLPYCFNIADGPFRAGGNAQGFRPFIGDYNGIASTNTLAAMTWTGVAPPQPLNLEIDFATATP